MISAAIDSSSHEASWEHSATWLLWLCCAVSLAFIQSVPTIPAVTFLGAVLAYCALFPRRAYLAVTWNFVPWAIVVFGMLSVLWSMEPMQSARAAPQIGITVLAAIMFAQGLPARAFIAALMYAQISSIVASLIHIRHIWSKEQPRASTCAGVAVQRVGAARRKPAQIRKSHCARSPAQCSLYAAFRRFRGSPADRLHGDRGIRCDFSVAPAANRVANSSVLARHYCCSVIALGIAFLSIDNLFDMFLLSIGKDTSLTGRTVLWSRAASIIADHPWGGVGLQAFWVEGNAEATRFWEMFYIYSHAGFHFHDLWLEIGVELGLIGIFIAAVTTIIVVFQRLEMGASRPGTGKLLFCRVRHAYHAENRR